ncbi:MULTISPECIES: hypothetical protein [unclassified Streptomyces]|uniref:hypothetical protein n=1 Tax=unclassified Streptomyces TaxID=2593676 RepID=UPI000CD58ECE|nr:MULTISPECIES: hypothetical protein [unclassified Streptomyces]AWL39684.1 hypothetical protein B9S64_17475 [Streptomyces sp. SM18]
MNTSTGATLAACLIAIAIMAIYLRKWWTGGRALKDLIPMLQGFLTGALATICVGGLAGWLAGCTRTATGGAGGTAITATTGTDAGDTLATASMGRLTPEGGAVTFLLFVILVVSYKAANKDDKGRLIGFLAAGMILCATAGVAGALDGLPGLINEAGAKGRNILEGHS